MSSQQVALALGVALVLTLTASSARLGGEVPALRYAYLACLSAAVLGALCALAGRQRHARAAELPAGSL